VEARVHGIKNYGVLCDLTLHPDVVGLISNDQLGCDPSSMKEGDQVSPIILDVSKKDGIVDLSNLDTVKDAIKSQNTSELYSIGECMDVTVLLSKPEESYCVVLMPTGRFPVLGYLGISDYNTIMTNNARYRPGITCKARVVALPATENENRLLLAPDLTNNVFKSGKKKRSLSNAPTAGSVVKINVDSIHMLHADVTLDGSGQRCRLHITQICEHDGKSLENPLLTLSPGSSHSAVVLETGISGKSDQIIDVSLLKGKFEASSLAKEWENLTAGQEIHGYVQEVKNDYVWVTFSPSMRGRAFIPALADTIDECCQISKKYIVGKFVRSEILHVDTSKHILDIALIEDGRVDKSFKAGDVVLAYITNLSGNGVKAKLSWDTYGVANLTDVDVAPFKNILSELKTNTFAKACILGSKSEKFQNIAFLESVGGYCGIDKNNTRLSPGVNAPNPELKLSDISVGDIVSGYVKSSGKIGVFVTLSRNIDARIKLRQLSDNFVEDPFSMFPPGTLVSGTVISVSNGKVDLTLRKRRVILSLDKYHEGQVVAGKVKRIESYGIFIALRDSNVSGLAHVSEICDGYVQDIHKLFNVGQDVQARILTIDKQAGKMSLGLKPSYFNLGDLRDVDNADGVLDIEDDEQDDLDAELLEKLQSSGEEDDVEMDHQSSSSLNSEEENDLDAQLLDKASEDSE
jgi:rRNA biogenesis protein RRP5